jgi:hypothetical protein
MRMGNIKNFVKKRRRLGGGGNGLYLDSGKRCGGAAEVGLSCVGVLGVVV